MLPPLNADGALPAGVHPASWADVEAAFAGTPWRTWLFDGLRRAALSLGQAGCRALWLDGSYVTAKEPPGDFDGCWDPVGVDPAKLDPVLLEFAGGRAAQKAKYGGELFPATWPADARGTPFVEFLQIDKETGSAKGIVLIDPRSAS